MTPFRPARPRLRRWAWLCVLAGCVAAAVAVGAGSLSGCAKSAPAQNAGAPQPANVPASPSVQSPPAGIAVARDAGAAQPPKQPDGTATLDGTGAADPQKQEVADQCAQLLKMATALKTEVDKTDKDTLSVAVVRKAGEIEQLAHKVRTGTGKD